MRQFLVSCTDGKVLDRVRINEKSRPPKRREASVVQDQGKQKNIWSDADLSLSTHRGAPPFFL